MEAGARLSFAHCSADGPALLDVLDPELPNRRVPVTQGQAGLCPWVGEAGGIEVQLQLLLPGPVHPALEMPGLDPIPVHGVLPKVSIHGMQVETVRTRDQGIGLAEVLSEFRQGARFAGKLTGHPETASIQILVAGLKSAHIIPLPAL